MNTMHSVFQGRSLLAEKDFTRAELDYLIDFAIHLKDLKKRGIPHHYLEGKNIALLFEKASTRTRAAFTIAAIDLGAHPEYLGAKDIQLGKKESVEDTAIILGSMFDGIEFRGFSQQTVADLAKFSGVPVWNGLTDEWHPTQMLADFMTIKEVFGKLSGLKLVYAGDGRNNVANSLLVTSAILGVDMTIAAPKVLFPTSAIVQLAKQFAAKSGAKLTFTTDIQTAVKGANILYTDVWASMGEEAKFEQRVKLLQPYQINTEHRLWQKNCRQIWHQGNGNQRCCLPQSARPSISRRRKSPACHQSCHGGNAGKLIYSESLVNRRRNNAWHSKPL